MRPRLPKRDKIHLINLCMHAELSRFSRVSLWPYGQEPARLLCPWDSPGKNTGVGCYFLPQGILPTQGLNSGLLCLPALAGGFFTTSATWERNIKITSLNGKHYIKLSASCLLKYNKYFNIAVVCQPDATFSNETFFLLAFGMFGDNS